MATRLTETVKLIKTGIDIFFRFGHFPPSEIFSLGFMFGMIFGSAGATFVIILVMALAQ